MELYRRTPVPTRLHVAAVAGYAAIFAALVAYGQPGLGLGQGFYIPIVLTSLASGPVGGAAAGILAAILYAAGLALRPAHLDAGFALRESIHLVSYVAAGVIVGAFAQRARGLLSDSLRVMDELLHLARRDAGSGALSPDGFEGELAARVARGWPFGLLVGELEDALDDRALRRATSLVCAELGVDTPVGRIGPSQLAVLASGTAPPAVRDAATALERALERDGVRATFGWSTYPVEAHDALSLFRAASERLYARRVVRGEWRPTPASAELVEDTGPRLRPAL